MRRAEPAPLGHLEEQQTPSPAASSWKGAHRAAEKLQKQTPQMSSTGTARREERATEPVRRGHGCHAGPDAPTPRHGGPHNGFPRPCSLRPAAPHPGSEPEAHQGPWEGSSAVTLAGSAASRGGFKSLLCHCHVRDLGQRVCSIGGDGRAGPAGS